MSECGSDEFDEKDDEDEDDSVFPLFLPNFTCVFFIESLFDANY